MFHRIASAVALIIGLAPTAVLAQTAEPPAAAVRTATTPTVRSAVNAAALVFEGDSYRLIGTGELGGLEIYGPDGARIGAVDSGEAVGIDVRYGVGLRGAPSTLAVAMDRRDGVIRVFAVSPGEAPKEISARPIRTSLAAESLCLYQSRRDRQLYAFVLGTDGAIEQWALVERSEGRYDGVLARTLHVPSEASYCVADDRSGELYVAEQAVGIWRFEAEPEAEIAPVLVDAVGLGHIRKEVAGLALFDGGAGARYLVAADASAGDYLVYERAGAKDRLVGRARIDGIASPAGLTGSRFGPGLLVIADDDNAGGANYKTVAFADIAAALNLPIGAPVDPRAPLDAKLAFVRPIAETEPVIGAGDAADDPAIWVDPADATKSLIVGTDKQGGLGLYDLAGTRIQFLPDGKMNNVDLRDGFRLGDRDVVLVTASDRTRKAIAIYALDPTSRTLANVADGLQKADGLNDPYGLCMYRSPRNGRFYVFINDTDGHMRQWRLTATKSGKVRADVVRTFAFDSQTEGCVADDETGVLYVAEEDVALWRMGAEPGAGSTKTAVARIADNPALRKDLEGVSIWAGKGGKGYLVVSSQGNDTYAVFRREGDNAYVGSFAIMGDASRGIDGASETDGLDVVSAWMGRAYSEGLLVVQDGRNVSPAEHQNFKLVSFGDVKRALGLD